jgi:hypothetical protein
MRRGEAQLALQKAREMGNEASSEPRLWRMPLGR